MIEAEKLCKDSEIIIIVGKSLSVYTAAEIIDFAPKSCMTFPLDPKEVSNNTIKNLIVIKEKASIGIPILANILLK